MKIDGIIREHGETFKASLLNRGRITRSGKNGRVVYSYSFSSGSTKKYNENLVPLQYRPDVGYDSIAKDIYYRELLSLAYSYEIGGGMLSTVGNRPWEIADSMYPMINRLVGVESVGRIYKSMSRLVNNTRYRCTVPIKYILSPERGTYASGGIIDYCCNDYDEDEKFTILDFDALVLSRRDLQHAINNVSADTFILGIYGCSRGYAPDALFNGELGSIEYWDILERTNIAYKYAGSPLEHYLGLAVINRR